MFDGWELNRTVLRFVTATIVAVLTGWPAEPLICPGSRPETWLSAKILDVFEGSLESRK
jgi:hypothetical protein